MAGLSRPLDRTYSSTRRNLIHCALRTLRKPLTGPETRCECGQNGHTNRVPCWLGCFSTSTAHPGLQNRRSTGSSGSTCNFVVFRAGLDARDDADGLPAPEPRRAAEMLRDALIVALFVTRRAGIIIGILPILLTRTYYRQSSGDLFRASDARQSSCRCAGYDASLPLVSGSPKASGGDCP